MAGEDFCSSKGEQDLDEHMGGQRDWCWLGEGTSGRRNNAGQDGRSKSLAGMGGGRFYEDTENGAKQMR